MKAGLNIINRIFCRKPCSRVRTDSNWTDLYPSPEPSFLKKTINKTCDFVYGSIDSFFQGNAKRITTCVSENHLIDNFNTDYSRVWELNQGVTDIALKDLKGSINWVLPGFVKRSAGRMYQYFMLYFYTDMIFEVEPITGEEKEDSNVGGLTRLNNGKTIHILHKLNERFNAKYLSIIDWYLDLYNKIIHFFKWEPETQTYYLLGFFGPQVFDNLTTEHESMIRGPDKFKLNSSITYHKRN